MDPITHSLVGGLAAKTVKASKRRFWIMMFLGEAPDLDVIFNSLGGWAYFLQHRGITHSVLGIFIQSVLYSFLFKKIDQGDFKTRAWHYSLPLIFHVLCDYMTSFGVPLLMPFSSKEFSGDLVVGLNIVPILFMVIGLIKLYRWDTGGLRATGPLWAAWGLYLMLAASGKAYAAKLAGINDEAMITLPTVVNPFEWRTVAVDLHTQTYRAYTIDILDKKKRKKAHAFSMPTSEFPIKASLNSSEVQEFLKNNRWPLVRVQPMETGWKVEWGNLLYSTRGVVRGKVLVQLDKAGHILDEQKICSFWNPDDI